MAAIVLDIGGTSIKSGIFRGGTLTAVRETATEASLGGAHVTERAMDIIRDYRQNHEFDHIGVSTAGQVDSAAGRIIYANENIPGYTGTELKQLMEAEFGLPTAVENDVNAAALGEAAFGAGRNQRDFICLTYGTGVGGALFLNGCLYSGDSFSAGEFGGIVIHPEARSPEEDLFSGCYERYASTTALVRRAQCMDETLCDGRSIFARWDEPAVRQLIDDWIMEIVYGLITIIHMINPACIILGGGIMEQPYILPQIQKELYPNLMPSFRHVQIRKAKLGNHAGMLGAATLTADFSREEVSK